jgi:hypothetical protein
MTTRDSSRLRHQVLWGRYRLVVGGPPFTTSFSLYVTIAGFGRAARPTALQPHPWSSCRW